MARFEKSFMRPRILVYNLHNFTELCGPCDCVRRHALSGGETFLRSQQVPVFHCDVTSSDRIGDGGLRLY